MRIQTLCMLAVVSIVSSSLAVPQDQTRNNSSPQLSTDADNLLEPIASHGPLNDYIPCIFNENEAIEMRAWERLPSGPKTLRVDDATAIKLYSATAAAISSRSDYDPEFVSEFLKAYSDIAKPENLVNKTFPEAYGKILDAAQQAAAYVQKQGQLPTLRNATEEEMTAAADRLVQAATVAAQNAMQNGSFPDPKARIGGQGAELLYDTTRGAIESFAAKNNYDPEVEQEFLYQYGKSLGSRFPTETAANALSTVTTALQSARNSIVNSHESLVRPTLKTNPGSAKDTRPIQEAALSVLDNVKAAASKIVGPKVSKGFKPPDDVACSMSVLTWNETKDIFGRRVANTYVGIQVTVRNLNAKNEFLIHDIQVAIDTGIDLREWGRFQAGHDKLLVRAVAQRGASEDRRNLILHSLEAIGAIAGSSSIAGSSDFKSAVAVFQGALIPGFSNIFPDHTVEQLNHINDLVFSASSTSKILVPIQGSVPLVTFIAEKPVEQLPFARCGRTHEPPRPICEVDQRYPHTTSGVSNDSEAALNLDSLPFSDWRARAIEVLERRTFVVLGGVHIQQVRGTPGIANLDCPTLTAGPVDISQTKDGVVSCSVTGGNLDKLSTVALEKDTDKLAGKIKPAKDGNSAVLTFDPAILSDHAGIYSIFLVDSSGTETDSGESMQLSVQPLITKIEEPSLDTTKLTLTVAGKHLDLIRDIALAPDETGGGPIAGQFGQAPKPSDSKAVVKFTNGGFVEGKQYHLVYTIIDDPGRQKTTSIVIKASTGTGPAADKKGVASPKPK